MPKKSIRFIARDLNRSYDYVKKHIEQMGIGPDDYSHNGTPTYNEETQRKIQTYMNIGIDWYCDKCGAHLNEQDDFNTCSGSWKCKECGFNNDVTESNVRWG